MAEIEQTVIQLLEWWVAISEKRCGCYAHSCQVEYKMRPKGPIYNNNEGYNPKRNPRR